jgi:hypothetical protein
MLATTRASNDRAPTYQQKQQQQQGKDGAHHPMNATCAYHTVLLANEVAVLFFLAHAATIYRGSFYFLYMLLILSKTFLVKILQNCIINTNVTLLMAV